MSISGPGGPSDSSSIRQALNKELKTKLKAKSKTEKVVRRSLSASEIPAKWKNLSGKVKRIDRRARRFSQESLTKLKNTFRRSITHLPENPKKEVMDEYEELMGDEARKSDDIDYESLPSELVSSSEEIDDWEVPEIQNAPPMSSWRPLPEGPNFKESIKKPETSPSMPIIDRKRPKSVPKATQEKETTEPFQNKSAPPQRPRAGAMLDKPAQAIRKLSSPSSRIPKADIREMVQSALKAMTPSKFETFVTNIKNNKSRLSIDSKGDVCIIDKKTPSSIKSVKTLLEIADKKHQELSKDKNASSDDRMAMRNAIEHLNSIKAPKE